MHAVRRSLSVALFALPLTAQSANVFATAIQPIAVQVADAAGSSLSTWSAGPLAASGMLSASLPGPGLGSAQVSWSTAGSSHRGEAYLEAMLDAATASPSFVGQIGPNEFLLQFMASGPAPAHLFAYRQSDLSPGAPWPTVQLDFGNDGTIDVADLGMSPVTPSVPAFGLQPFVVRVVVDASLAGAGHSHTWVFVQVWPENDVTWTNAAVGCSASGFPQVLEPTFVDRGFDLWSWPGNDPIVVVVGLSLQPLLLPSMPWAQCLLLPAPDILMVPLPGAPFLHIALPAALRPVGFWIQTVEVTAMGLWTTDAARVVAH